MWSTLTFVTKDLHDQMFTPIVPIPESNGFGYGYGWFIGRQFNRQVFVHDGHFDGFRASISRFPVDKMTVIVLSNQERTDINEVNRHLAQIVFGEP
jgi:CubicO group peptidase (beta-lactamase class C family)